MIMIMKYKRKRIILGCVGQSKREKEFIDWPF